MNQPTQQQRWRFIVTRDDGHDMTAEIESFANWIGLEAAAPSRYSLLLVLGLFGGFKSGMLNPAVVVHEIRALEGIGPPSRLRSPIRNRHAPLKGLWHKHYQQNGLASLAMNVKRALAKHSIPLFKQRIKEVEEAGEQRYVTPEDIPDLVADAIGGNLNRLAAAQAITGEWLMFAQHEGKNYYLCLATHDKRTHDQIRQQIVSICCTEFAFLRQLMEQS